MDYNSLTTFLGHYSNDKILEVLRKNLSECDEFRFSVSFIKESGLALIFNDIESALKRGVSGIIVTTNYLKITDSTCLSKLLALMKKYPKQFKTYFLETTETDYSSFHTKGYIFVKDNVASIVVGSSNLSETALTQKGGEWSLFSKTLKNGELFDSVDYEFNENIKQIVSPLSQDQIDKYCQLEMPISFGKVEPNYMQTKALEALKNTRDIEHKNKALIVAAMGSGKTYLSAFDSKNFKAKRILYICHSETVLRKAELEFRDVYQNEKTFGFLTGNAKDFNADVVFATNISINKHLGNFKKDDFDYIIVDEAHHAPAKTYSSVVNYFNYKFLLGMTGTPDRTDQQNAREVFGNSIPYELSLRSAIESGVIMPFKYYSVYDGLVDYSSKNPNDKISDQMTTDNHGYFIDSQIKGHIHEINGKLKCLAFCINVEHAKKTSELLRKIGYKTAYVCESTSTFERNDLYNKLQDENNELQIICSVNVMNEGVDLPAVNMALFLRPTESSIIFIQQLGRSLRKYENKNRPVIIDFIGNKYERSIYIAWALGELAKAPVLTKPILKQIISGENKSISQLDVEIKMDDESKKEVIQQLEKTNFNTSKILESSFKSFKQSFSLMSCPKHVAFLDKSHGFDLLRIIGKYKSYYNFLVSIKEKNVPCFTKEQAAFIEYLSEFLPLSRPYEFRIIRSLVDSGPIKKDALKELVKLTVDNFSDKQFEHAINVLELKAESQEAQEKKVKYLLNESEDIYSLNIKLQDEEINSNGDMVEINFNDSQFKIFVIDLLNYGIMRFEQDYLGTGFFELHKTYSRKEFTRIICHPKVWAFQPGVFYNSENTMVSIFVDMIKDDDVEEHLNYGDKFLSKSHFEWESQTDTIIGNKKYNRLMSFETVHVFVRKFKSEDSMNLPYVYLGKGKLSNPRKTQNKNNTVKFDVVLDNELTDELFDQFNIDLSK